MPVSPNTTPEQVEAEVYDAATWRCAPYHSSRAGSSPVPLLILLIIGVNYVAVVLFTLDMGVDAGKVVGIVIFHLLIGLMFLSWCYTCCTDPGTAPDAWQRQMSAAASRGESIPVCRRSGLYKPPRSHYDSVTERLTLNMDHFCPWVVNTVGFYNRKFFMLFLIYANLTMLHSVIYLLCQMPRMLPWLMVEDGTGARDRWFPGLVPLLIVGGAMGIDCLLVFCLLGPFMVFHLGMAAKNETTIEGSSNPHYNVGVMANLRSVFGHKIWTWPIPLYLHGPDGDGLHWPGHPSSIGRPRPRSQSSGTQLTTVSASVTPTNVKEEVP